MAEPADGDPRIDALFALPPEEFTTARNTLVKELRGEGDRTTATAVGKLRRPTVAAWAVNQTVRTHRDAFDRLLEAGDAVRRVQRRALSGVRGDGMRDAMRTRRAQIEALADAAAEFLVERGIAPDSHRSDIVATFDAASADEAAAAEVAGARLSQPLPVSSGFGGLGGFTLVAGDADEPQARADATTAGSARDSAPADGPASVQPPADRSTAQAEREERAAKARRDAMRALDAARRQLADAEATLARAEAEVIRAEARAEGAEQAARVAEQQARRLRAQADEQESRAQAARERVAEVTDEVAQRTDEVGDREHRLQSLDD